MLTYFEGLLQALEQQEETVKAMEIGYKLGINSMEELVKEQLELKEMLEEVDRYTEEDGIFL